MSKKTVKNSDEQEIDLGQISQSIKNSAQKINKSLFMCLQFFLKNIITVSVLLILGLGIGIYLDKKIKTYNHQIIVTPNFGSTDYLYSKIDLIQSKINESDTVFLKDVIGIQDPKKLVSIKIQPIFDVYRFIENKPENFELIKLMAEDGNIKEIIKENLTSKNYTYHIISFTTNKATSNEKTVQPILNYLNDSDFYAKIQKSVLNNVNIKMIENDTIISQINSVLGGFSNSVTSSQKSQNLVYYNENTQLNDVIKTKDLLVREQGSHRIELVGLDKIVKDNSIILNNKNTKSINGKLKFILPLFFILGFVLIRFFINFYKKQKALLESNQ
jgi:hypothetical protein